MYHKIYFDLSRYFELSGFELSRVSCRYVLMHDHGVVCVFFSLDIVPELTAPTNKARQRLTNFIRPGSRGRSQSKTAERYIYIFTIYLTILLYCVPLGSIYFIAFDVFSQLIL